MEPTSEAHIAERQVDRFVESLKLSSDSAVKSKLANLRRGLGHHPADIPEVWGDLFSGLYNNAETKLLFQVDGVTQLEWAIYVSLTLFALHQQSKDIKSSCMSCQKESLGRAVRRLADVMCKNSKGKAESKDNDKGETHAQVWRRFSPIIKAADMDAVAYHLRCMVSLLRANEIGLDYPRLARDLYLFQIPSMRQKVCMSWGRDFHSYIPAETSTENN